MSNTITGTVVKLSKIFGKWSHRYLCHREFSPITLFCRRETSVFQETDVILFWGGVWIWVCMNVCGCVWVRVYVQVFLFSYLLLTNAENPIEVLPRVHRYCSGSFFHLAVMPLHVFKNPKVFSFISWLFSREVFFFFSSFLRGRKGKPFLRGPFQK